jgi:anaerobic selenocysteine-containing dehydrogenase
MMHPVDAAKLGIADGDAVTLGNMRVETTLIARIVEGLPAAC